MTLTLTIPLPPKGCSPNLASSRHWQNRAHATEWYRERVATIAGVALPSDWVQQKVRISTTWYMGQTDEEIALRAAKNAGARSVKGIQRMWAVKVRPLDSTNAASCLKGAIDGLVDAGVVPKDDHRWVSMDSPVLLRTAKEHNGRAEIVLKIETMEGLF